MRKIKLRQTVSAVARVTLGAAILFLLSDCGQRDVSAGGRSGRPGGPTPFQAPSFAIDVEDRDGGIVFAFKGCGTRWEPFIERLEVTKVSPSSDAGRMCAFESDNPADVLKRTWRYGDSAPGFEKCWPLTEGTYFVTGIGSGAADTKFVLKKKWFRTGFTVRTLMGGCPK